MRMATPRLKHFCPQCKYGRSFRNQDEFRANRFCPKDGTMLRPTGWEAKARVRRATIESEASVVAGVVASKPFPASKRVKLRAIAIGQMGLVLEAKVISKKSDKRSAWREHAMTMVSDGTATLPLNLWKGAGVPS
jgi:hypothetical protein